MKRRASRIVEHAEEQLPQPREIDREQSQDGAELDQDVEGLAERFVVEAEKVADQQQMAGRGDRNELGQAFDDAEEYGLDHVQRHGRAPLRDRALTRPNR